MPNKHRVKGIAQMRDYALKKPVAITVDGKFILPLEVEAEAILGMAPIGSLNTSLQQKLTLERIKEDPKYDLGILGLEKVTKEEVIAHVEQLTDLGKEIVSAEVNYCHEFISGLTPAAASFPKIKPQKRPIPSWGPWGPWKPPYKWVKLYIKNTVVFCEASVDTITSSAAQYRIAHVHPAFAARGFNVVSLEGANDTRANFAPEAKKPFVDYISGIGHGAPNEYTGDKIAAILQVGAYDPLEVKGKVIHLLSCQTAKELGKDVVTNGAKAYAGYFENFTIVWDDPATPGNETELFWESDSTFDIGMANGYTVEQAHNATIAAYNAAIASVPNTSAATWLTWDRNYFRSPVSDAAYGDRSALAPNMTAIWVPVPFAISELATAVEAKVGEQEAPAPEKVAIS